MRHNILLVSHSSELNGAEKMLFQTVQRIDRQRFYPLLIIPRPGPFKDEAESRGIRTKIVPMKWWLSEKKKTWKQPASWLWNIKSVFAISRIIDEENISLVLSNSSVAFSGALASRMKKVPHVWIIHEILGGRKPQVLFLFGNRWLVKLIQRLSSRIIVNSRATRSAFGDSEKIHLVYNGLEVEDLKSFPEKTVMEEFSLTEEDTVLGVVGKICKEKGQREVVLAMASLIQEYPKLKLLLVGGVRDKRYYSKLLNLIKKHELERRIIFTGYRKDVLKLLRLIDLLLVTSEVESFGLAAIEAMAVGTPVIAVQSGGIQEIITDGEDGFLVESRDPDVLKKTLRSVLADQLKRDEVAGKGCLTVAEKFSLSRQVKKIEGVMDECLERL